MPTFRFEAMDAAGEVQKDQIQAANSGEAIRQLRANGLFVTSLNELANLVAEAPTGDSLAVAAEHVPPGSSRPRQGRCWGVVVTAVGLACAGLGLYGAIDSIWFGIGAEHANATVVGVVPGGEDDVDVLEFAASDGCRYRVDARGAWHVLWAPDHGLNVRVPVLYPANSPEKARLADFTPRFGIPLILLVLGSIFTPAGLLVWRRGLHRVAD